MSTPRKRYKSNEEIGDIDYLYGESPYSDDREVLYNSTQKLDQYDYSCLSKDFDYDSYLESDDEF